MSTRSRVLTLYRSILRTGRTWQGPPEECEYIRQEARSLFRQNKDLSAPEEIEAMIKEGQDRRDLAVHYKIPYPRLQHIPQFKKRDYLDVPIIR